MSRKTQHRPGHERRIRQRLFKSGNIRCPICLSDYGWQNVVSGDVTGEHAPPKSMGGVAICLTCKKCNHEAGLVDQHAYLSQKARAEWSAGHGTPIVVDFFGNKKLNRFVPSDPKAPFPFRSHMFRNGTIKLGALPSKDQLDEKKGLGFSIPYRDDYEFVSMIKTAYLMVFSLMGRNGYNFAENVALEPVREQIMNPNRKILKGAFVIDGNMPQPEDNSKRLIHFCLARPPCWMVPLWNNKIVVLPCGGTEPIDDLKFSEETSSVSIDMVPFWASVRFFESSSMSGPVQDDVPVEDGSLLGLINSSPATTENGEEFCWIVVYHHNGRYVALPCVGRSQQPGSVAGVEMLSESTVTGRGIDRKALVRVGQRQHVDECPIFVHVNQSLKNDDDQ